MMMSFQQVGSNQRSVKTPIRLAIDAPKQNRLMLTIAVILAKFTLIVLKKAIPWIGICILICFFSACQQSRQEKHPQGLSLDHLQDLLSQPPPLPQRSKDIHSQVSERQLPIPPSMQKPVSLTLTEALPLKDVFLEISRQAGIDLQLEPAIEGKLIFSAHKRPFIEVIQHLCELSNLRYRIMGQSLRIEVDAPYVKNYNVRFLNLSRTSQNHVSVSTDVFTAASTAVGQASADNGSRSIVDVASQNDFWAELEANLKTILGEGSRYTFHKQAGLLTVLTPERQHILLESYLKKLHRAISSQVVIEAKIIEVSLYDEFRSGINWQRLIDSKASPYVEGSFGQYALQGHFSTAHAAAPNMLAFGFKNHSFSAILRMIEEFGATQILSSPRLTVMNNQTAILKVARNQVYFRLHYDKQLSLNVNRENIVVSSDIQTVPIGLVMMVQPSIEEESGDIILSLRPTISRLIQSVHDPAVDIALTAHSHADDSPTPARPSLIPVVEVREIDSILKLKNGEIGVLGGLMEIRSVNETSQLPILGDIPVVREVFSSNADQQQIVELVILIRAIITEEPSPDSADSRLYENYTQDPRRAFT